MSYWMFSTSVVSKVTHCLTSSVKQQRDDKYARIGDVDMLLYRLNYNESSSVYCKTMSFLVCKQQNALFEVLLAWKYWNLKKKKGTVWLLMHPCHTENSYFSFLPADQTKRLWSSLYRWYISSLISEHFQQFHRIIGPSDRDLQSWLSAGLLC